MVGKLWFWCKILTGRADGGAETLYIETRKSPGGFPGLVWLFVCFNRFFVYRYAQSADAISVNDRHGQP